jgi:hypothetical protein
MYFDYLIKEMLLYGVNEGAMGEVSYILKLKTRNGAHERTVDNVTAIDSF